MPDKLFRRLYSKVYIISLTPETFRNPAERPVSSSHPHPPQTSPKSWLWEAHWYGGNLCARRIIVAIVKGGSRGRGGKVTQRCRAGQTFPRAPECWRVPAKAAWAADQPASPTFSASSPSVVKKNPHLDVAWNLHYSIQLRKDSLTDFFLSSYPAVFVS